MKKLLLFIAVLFLSNGAYGQGIIANYQSANQFEEIPAGWFDQVRMQFGTQWPAGIFFGTRSHGSQLLQGMGILESQNPELFLRPMVQQQTGLAGQFEEGVFWTDATRQYLQNFPDTKIVMWAMCRVITGILTVSEIEQCLADMSQLEAEYPDIKFVYWTDVLDEFGAEGELEQRNNLIREFCQVNGKVLYDFADITAHDPNGDYFPGTSEGGSTWCADWCIENYNLACDTCLECPHSECFDCYRKAKAFWWLLARLSGWEGSAAPLVTPPAQDISCKAWPNPFNPRVEVSFSLPMRSTVQVDVVDLKGGLVSRLTSGVLVAGDHTVTWHGRRMDGNLAEAGLYFVRISDGRNNVTQKITLLK